MATQEHTNPGRTNPGRGQNPKDKSQLQDDTPDESGTRSGKDKSDNKGNFANDPQRAREPGHKGGQGQTR